MKEKRTVARHRVLKSGTIEFNRAGGISCTVRNLSNTGAALAVASPLGIPDTFDLVIAGDDVRHSCRIVWRKEKQIGVAFRRQ
jgi:hypothetical protein